MDAELMPRSGKSKPTEHTVDSRILEKIFYWLIVGATAVAVFFSAGIYTQMIGRLSPDWGVWKFVPLFPVGVLLACLVQGAIVRPMVLKRDRRLIRGLVGGGGAIRMMAIREDDDPATKLLKKAYNATPTRSIAVANKIALVMFCFDLVVAVYAFPPITGRGGVWLAATTGRGIDWAHIAVILFLGIAVPGFTYIMLHLGEIAYHHKQEQD